MQRVQINVYSALMCVLASVVMFMFVSVHMFRMIMPVCVLMHMSVMLFFGNFPVLAGQRKRTNRLIFHKDEVDKVSHRKSQNELHTCHC